MTPGARGARRIVALATIGWIVAGATPLTLAAQDAPRPVLSIELPADSLLLRKGPTIRAQNMLSREKVQKLLLAGFPARFHFRVQLWSEGRWFWIDHLQSSTEYDLFVRYVPVDKRYEVIQVQDDRPLSLGRYEALRDAESAVGRAYAPPVTAARLRDLQYYQVNLVIEALSDRDLDEVERWLKGDIEPGMTGQANPASVLSRGVRSIASKLLGGEKTEYEETSTRFRVQP